MVIGIFPLPGSGAEYIRKKQMKNWTEVEQLYALFLEQNFDAVKSRLSES